MLGDIVIIDYGMGNLRSVQKKFERIGAKSRITREPSQIAKAEKLVLPGVGHFSQACSKLKEFDIWDVLNQRVLNDKTPVLGICLGMQLMAKTSTEGNAEGLGWFDAEVVKFNIQDRLQHKVPHTGWNNAAFTRDTQFSQGISNDSSFYFVHAYHIVCNDPEDVLATTDYEYTFTSAIQRDNIWGTQFHPEKSHDVGEKLIKNFVELT